MNTRFVCLVVVVGISVALTGCGTFAYGPGVVKVMQARTNSTVAYYGEQAKSYRAGGSGKVNVTARLVPPIEYQNGVLINKRKQDVTFVIAGDDILFNDTEDVEALHVKKTEHGPVKVGGIKAIDLPPGHYQVSVYVSGQEFPYKQWCHFVDAIRGNSSYNGVNYDFTMIAP